MTKILILLFSILLASSLSAQEVNILAERFNPPTGYKRIKPKADSFAESLLRLPLQNKTTVLSYAGNEIDAPSAAVVALDVGSRDLQQCADVILRLHAEWLWAQNRTSEISYHFTSGDRSSWKSWEKGERFIVNGRYVKRVRKGHRSSSYNNFKTYLFHLFRYAGTRSLALDSQPIKIGKVQAGDFFVLPGSPGHAVIVLDVVINKKGEKLMLIGQGFMPAQEFHVITATHTIDKVWFKVPDIEGEIDTPSWAPFPATTLRRFKVK